MHSEDEKEESVIFPKEVETATAIVSECLAKLVIITMELTFDLSRGKHLDCDLRDQRDPKESGGL